MSPAAATSSPFAAAISACGMMSLDYAKALLEPIPVAVFAHLAHPQVNHPAFCTGHLAIYLNRVLDLVGRKDLALALPFDEATFKAGSPCVEQDGRYPAKSVLLGYFLPHSVTVLEAMAEVPAERLAAPNPMEGRMKEMFPTVGAATNFLLNNHVMMHLGQVSAWRRVMGLGSAF
ncbi:MAG: DinB family protein [Phycisphaerae bacterium]|nr:DinB family protein [Phycisphaerae bacterium]